MGIKEQIEHNGELLALIIRANYNPEKTEFITPETFKQQVGFIVYDANKDIEPHIHHEMPRNIKGTSEVLILRNGHVRVDFYSQKKNYTESRELFPGDVLILVSGGHGFHFHERSIFLEIKQGPYIGVQEKERFSSTLTKRKIKPR
ncbi:MAG: hypothetical protein JSV93_05335 [Candidatus Omnitrophota bacterium]|nr:MAG: hypothetical protein JSV93_05335 [Candidatus Omnitrophota bacterium]